MNIIFLIYKWRIGRKIKWIDRYCSELEQRILVLKSADNIDDDKISYCENKLKLYKNRMDELKIKYGVNQA